MSIFISIKIKKEMFRKFTHYLTKKEIDEVHKAFKLFDQDGSGSISIRQFDQILKSLGQNLCEQELQIIVQKIDRDGNGFIDFDQFLYLVAPKIISNRSEKSYVEAFKLLDVNNKGHIGLIELQKANLVAGAGLTTDEINQILEYVQEKFKGKLNLDAALKMLQRLPENVEDEM